MSKEETAVQNKAVATALAQERPSVPYQAIAVKTSYKGVKVKHLFLPADKPVFEAVDDFEAMLIAVELFGGAEVLMSDEVGKWRVRLTVISA